MPSDTTTPPPAPTEPSAEALAALPDGRESFQTDLGKALAHFEFALGTAWCTDQRESATMASMKRDWGRAEKARANLRREIRLALDRFAAAREQGRSERQILDEAVVEAARKLVAHPWPLTGKIVPLRDALAARDAAIRARAGEE